MKCLTIGTRLRSTLFHTQSVSLARVRQQLRSVSAFPLDKPSWSVSKLLKRPNDAMHKSSLEESLGKAELVRLYALSGLKLPDVSKESEHFEHVLTDINKLRDFLSHIQAVAICEDLESVRPLVRITNPVVFTSDEPEGGLQLSDELDLQIGEKVLDMAKKRSGAYLIVED
ncbi:hypothetical protein GGI11_002392 [Coemansia sp. RSA 2049]|nr:hypothetical protein GGI11_002392 [Coemansia sp. RSA 2049]